jgi:hypothetical protein
MTLFTIGHFSIYLSDLLILSVPIVAWVIVRAIQKKERECRKVPSWHIYCLLACGSTIPIFFGVHLLESLSSDVRLVSAYFYIMVCVFCFSSGWSFALYKNTANQAGDSAEQTPPTDQAKQTSREELTKWNL